MTSPVRRGFAVAVLTACALVLAPAGAAEDGGGDGATPVPATELIAKLADADAVAGAAARVAAADELVKRGAAAVPDLVVALADPKLRLGVAGVIERIGPAAKDAVPALTAIAKGAGSPARPTIVRALGAIGASASPAVPALGAIVAYQRAKDRVEAANAIERILVDAARTAPRTIVPTPVDRAIADGCDWLIRHQSKDGPWDCDGFSAMCAPGAPCSGAGESVYDPGVTGLATLALLGGAAPAAPGTPPDAADAGRTSAIDAALAYLTAVQDSEGHFGPRTSIHHNYNHACAALAVADAAARTGRADLREPLERSVKYTLDAQNPYLAWRYGVHDNDNDTSVTAWMTKVLLRAADAGVAVKPDWQAGALAWVEKMTEPAKGRTGYQQRGGPTARTTEMQERFPGSESESLTACGLYVRLALGRVRDEYDLVPKGLALLGQQRPAWVGRGSSVDLYYWMNASEVMRLAGGADYPAWRTALVAALLPHQIPAGKACDAGSWPAADPWSPEGGRVYTTSAALLALEACREDPATRPALPGSAKPAIDALAKAAADPEQTVGAAAARALSRIRGAYRP